MLFVFGALFYPLFENLYNSKELGGIKIYEMLGMKRNLVAFLLIVAAVGMFYAATMVEKKVDKVEYLSC